MRRFAIAVAAMAVLAGSLMLLEYAQWVHQIADGSRALAAEDYPAAERAFAVVNVLG